MSPTVSAFTARQDFLCSLGRQQTKYALLRSDIPIVFIIKISQGSEKQHVSWWQILSPATLPVCIKTWMMNYHSRAWEKKWEHPRMNVVLQIQTLSIPQGWDKSGFFYDNLTIHCAISSLTAAYADVHGSGVLCCTEDHPPTHSHTPPPWNCSASRSHWRGLPVVDKMLKHCAPRHSKALSLTYLAYNSLWWIGPDWTCSLLSNPCHLEKIDLLAPRLRLLLDS